MVQLPSSPFRLFWFSPNVLRLTPSFAPARFFGIRSASSRVVAWILIGRGRRIRGGCQSSQPSTQTTHSASCRYLAPALLLRASHSVLIRTDTIIRHPPIVIMNISWDVTRRATPTFSCPPPPPPRMFTQNNTPLSGQTKLEWRAVTPSRQNIF